MKLWQTIVVAASSIALYKAFQKPAVQEVLVKYEEEDWDEDWEWFKSTMEGGEFPEADVLLLTDIPEEIDSAINQSRIDMALDIINDPTATEEEKEQARNFLRESDY